MRAAMYTLQDIRGFSTKPALKLGFPPSTIGVIRPDAQRFRVYVA